jgi:hypothetical protein
MYFHSSFAASIWSGKSSNSSYSAPKITALALNSITLEHLGHISAGIETINIFRKPLVIPANNNWSLEIVFEENAKDPEDYEKVERNRSY